MVVHTFPCGRASHTVICAIRERQGAREELSIDAVPDEGSLVFCFLSRAGPGEEKFFGPGQFQDKTLFVLCLRQLLYRLIFFECSSYLNLNSNDTIFFV